MGVLAYEPHVVMHAMHVDMLQQRLYTWQLLQTATSRVLHRICRPYITHSAKSQHPPEASLVLPWTRRKHVQLNLSVHAWAPL